MSERLVRLAVLPMWGTSVLLWGAAVMAHEFVAIVRGSEL